MTLKELIYSFEKIAMAQPAINQIVKSGDIYDLNSEQNVKYGVFCATQQQHTQIGDFINYSFFLYYVDRLKSDNSNKIDIQSHGISTLANILRTLEYNEGVEISDIVYQPFTQSFASECAGVYATVTVQVPLDSVCEEIYG